MDSGPDLFTILTDPGPSLCGTFRRSFAGFRSSGAPGWAVALRVPDHRPSMSCDQRTRGGHPACRVPALSPRQWESFPEQDGACVHVFVYQKGGQACFSPFIRTVDGAAPCTGKQRGMQAETAGRGHGPDFTGSILNATTTKSGHPMPKALPGKRSFRMGCRTGFRSKSSLFTAEGRVARPLPAGLSGTVTTPDWVSVLNEPGQIPAATKENDTGLSVFFVMMPGMCFWIFLTIERYASLLNNAESVVASRSEKHQREAIPLPRSGFPWQLKLTRRWPAFFPICQSRNTPQKRAWKR